MPVLAQTLTEQRSTMFLDEGSGGNIVARDEVAEIHVRAIIFRE